VASILDGAPIAPAAPAAPAVPVVDPEWFYADGVKGTGKAPDWYKASKYKTVDEQAKAYAEAEKMLGGFTGAPKDGYKFNLPEGVELVQGYELDKDPLFVDISALAKKSNVSQAFFDELVGTYAKHMMVDNTADPKIEAKKALGEKADERIAAVSQWAKANFDDATFQQLRAATSGANAADVIAVVEAAIAKSRVVLPKPGQDASGPSATVEAAIKLEMDKKGPDGKLLFFTDQKHREKVEQMRFNLYKAQAA
jgi:hypothetical protein